MWIVVALVCLFQSAPSTTQAAAEPGLIVTFESGGQTDARVARLAAVAVAVGEPPSPFLKPGQFTATFDGFINLKLRGEYVFTIQGRGRAELRLNGQPVLSSVGDDLSIKSSERVRLKKGANAIALQYTSPVTGDAIVRLYWSEKHQPAEPISPVFLTHADASDALVKSTSWRRGRELIEEWRCVRCHKLDGVDAAEAPNLTTIGARLNGPWMALWIHDPKSVRADALMPRVLRGESDARDAAAYLSTLSARRAMIAFKSDDAAIGAHLFTALGCIACHVESRLPLAYVPAKWKPAALVDYLRDPQKNYSASRMPNFKLSEDEARQLAAFLVGGAGNDQPAADGDAERGKKLVASSGCLNCHSIEGQPTEHRAPAMAQLHDMNHGCLGDQPPAPQFGLRLDEREAIRAALVDRDALARDTPIDRAEREVRQLNCVACHTRDTQPDVWSSLRDQVKSIEDAHPIGGRDVLPLRGDQSRPSLTWAGERLRTSWMATFITGGIEYKPRPWLAARMPAFGATRGKALADGFVREHGWLPDADAPQSKVEERDAAEIGRKLVGKASGFSCTACHAVGTVEPTGAFEAQGVNFARISERMRFDFYRRWVRNPQRYEPGTRMPQYSDAQGKTPLKDFFAGDAEKQFDAIWRYLCTGDKIQPPD